MWKLIRLEYKKYNWKKSVLIAGIILAVLALFFYAQCFLGIANDAETGVPDSADGMQYIGQQIELFTNLCYLVFTASMLSTFIVGAQKDKGMTQMFFYPIARWKILLSKMLAAWIFNFAALFLTKFILCAMIAAVGATRPSSFIIEYNLLSGLFYVQILLKSVVTVTVAYVALFFGELLHSSKATLIGAFLLFFLMNGTVNEFTLSRNAVVPFFMAALGILSAAACFIGLETKDVA